MKTTGRISKRVKATGPGVKGTPGYYFHADEDFREDFDWGKRKTVAAKAGAKPANKF